MKDSSIVNSSKSAKNILSRSRFILFIIILASGLIFAIFTLNHILAQLSTDTPVSSQTIAKPITFDQSTISELNELKTSSDNLQNQELPSGRINPFSE